MRYFLSPTGGVERWNGGRGRAVSPAAGSWPAGDSRPRSRRGPEVKPFTPDPSGPSETRPACHRNDRCSTVDARRGRTDRDAQRA